MQAFNKGVFRITRTLIFRQLARALARADACGRWSPYSSFPSFVSLSPAPPSSPLLVNCPPCFSLSPLPILCHPLAPQFSLKQLLSTSFSPFSPQFFNLPGILILLNLCFPKKISPLTLCLPIFVPPGPLPPQRWWDLGGTRCLA